MHVTSTGQVRQPVELSTGTFGTNISKSTNNTSTINLVPTTAAASVQRQCYINFLTLSLARYQAFDSAPKVVLGQPCLQGLVPLTLVFLVLPGQPCSQGLALARLKGLAPLTLGSEGYALGQPCLQGLAPLLWDLRDMLLANHVPRDWRLGLWDQRDMLLANHVSRDWRLYFCPGFAPIDLSFRFSTCLVKPPFFFFFNFLYHSLISPLLGDFSNWVQGLDGEGPSILGASWSLLCFSPGIPKHEPVPVPPPLKHKIIITQNEDEMLIDESKTQVMDFVNLQNEDAMLIDEHESQITKMGVMDDLSLNDEEVILIDQDGSNNDMDVDSLDEEDVMLIDQDGSNNDMDIDEEEVMLID
ncbi:uncharacterized protein EDB93DRAFT_1103277 [Suillus bovinus]|uniref:uncharacterized protein n=1 Tax=Suillus bovinus TaxID=48563 RepID=UPI001B882E10|nr:uncharacterized protein EDB93DRAFT_1103277 [Suillus bovinus]KAG2151054.1 hypothetical protein EDB93DRAFT_1103277 [Suillus bovinus]